MDLINEKGYLRKSGYIPEAGILSLIKSILKEIKNFIENPGLMTEILALSVLMGIISMVLCMISPVLMAIVLLIFLATLLILMV